MSSSAELVKSSAPASPISIEAGSFPWLGGQKHESIQIQPYHFELHDGTEFLYASLIRHNSTLAKIADKVSHAESDRAQAMVFRGLPSILNGEPVKHVGKLDGSSNLSDTDLFVASGTLNTAPSLVVAIKSSPREQQTPPVVLRAGITTEKLRPKLLKVMGLPLHGRRQGV